MIEFKVKARQMRLYGQFSCPWCHALIRFALHNQPAVCGENCFEELPNLAKLYHMRSEREKYHLTGEPPMMVGEIECY